MPGSSTTPGRLGARVHAPIRVAFRIRNGVGTRDNNLCEAQWLACAFPYRRFAAVLTDDHARLGADVVSYSFIVSDLHRLLVAGLPAHCESLCSPEPRSTLPRGPRGFPDALTIHRWRSSTSWPISAAAAFLAGMPCGSGLPIRPTERPSMRCCSRRGSRPRRRFAASKLAFVTGTGARSICLAPTICRSSSNSSGKTGWPPAASWPSAGPSSCPACGSRYFCSPPETTMSSRANRCSRSESWSTDGAARSTRPLRRADISACSWVRKPSPTCGGRLRTGFDRKNVFEARGRVRRRQRHNRADSQMRAGRADQTRRPKSAIAI